MSRRSRNIGRLPHSLAEAQAQAAEFFISALRDPDNPRYCGVCLLGAFILCTPAERASNLSPAQSRRCQPSTVTQPGLWNTVVAFLTFERTQKQLGRLLIRLSTCRCRMDQQYGHLIQYHEVGQKHSDMFILRMRRMGELIESQLDARARENMINTFRGRALILELFGALTKAVEDSGIRCTAKGTSKSWPFHATDLIPNGADNFVQSILRWHDCMPDPAIFATTAYILRICQHLLFPSLVKFKFSHIFLAACRKLVDLTIIDIYTNDDDLRARASQRFQFFISSWAPFFKMLSDNISTDVQAEFWRGCETKAVQMCSIILYLTSDPRLPPHGVEGWVGNLVTPGWLLFRLFHMHLYPRPDIPVHPKIEQFDRMFFPPPASTRSPQAGTLTAIRDFRTESRCSARGCPNTLQSVGRNFQRCGRCIIVSYCGRECQTKAWKDEQYPHKRICPLLRSLVEIGGGLEKVYNDEDEIIFNQWTAAGIEEEQFKFIADWYKSVTDARAYPLPDGTEWTSGYEDYNEIIAQLSAEGRGPEPKYLDRLARWPCEVAKEKALLKMQPFWDQEIDC